MLSKNTSLDFNNLWDVFEDSHSRPLQITGMVFFFGELEWKQNN